LLTEDVGMAVSVHGEEPLGRVFGVTGSQASVRLKVRGVSGDGSDARATVGRFLGVRTATSLLVGLITKVSAPAQTDEGQPPYATGDLDLLGEVKQDENGKSYFQRGVTDYPAIGDPAHMISPDELRLVYDVSRGRTIKIGHLQQDASIDAYVNVDDMLNKHFAIFGTTGVGKSSGVALILRQVLEARPDFRLFLIDPHNEYGRSFGDYAQVLNPRNLKLPFWLFNFEEIIDVFFRGRPGVEEEVEILSEAIPIAKAMFANNRGGGERPSLRKYDAKSTGFTIDTPVPYQLSDLVSLIDERMGKLENRATWTKYHRVITRIETVRNDPRYGFMFDNANVGGDTMVDVLAQLFRLPPNGKPMTIMQLAGFPAEVVDSVVSVLCRMAFDFGLWSDGAVPLLFVCEEAHRYAPADRAIGFGPTRKAISRVAKEGRKYGVFLALITQRPAELDATIISQCSTLFAMRMANDRDQAIVRSAVSDAAASLLAFVPSLGTREVFAFGEGVALPTRLHFSELPAHLIPKSETVTHGRMEAGRGIDKDFIAIVVERWRGAMMSQKLTASAAEPVDDFETIALAEFTAMPAKPGVELEHFEHAMREDPAPAAAPRYEAPPTAPAMPAEPPRYAALSTTAARSVEAAGDSLLKPANKAFSADLQDLRRRLKSRGAP
jgi:DNA helicase HerA-like ATPase